MKNNNLERGSIWRKWDLHVHSPESDSFSGTWNNFETQLQNADCAVIGINDYFSVAGYKKIKEKIENKTLDLRGKVILPVVEMRMSDLLQNRHTSTNSSIHFNFHIIFSDKLYIDDIENFIKSLESGDSIIGADYNTQSILKEKKVSFKETLKRLNCYKKFSGKFLIWLPYDEYGGIGDIDPDSDGWIKEEFIKKSHILGSANKKNIDFFLWKSPVKNDGTPKFEEKEFEKWFKNKKPCIKGSDSHSATCPIGELKDRDSKPIEKFCWIKADPTFEGLRQIVYEPEDRVKIQELKLEEKETYQIIDKVKFINDLFTKKEISINQNLTTIIGGKSTGKSILLRNIAQTIDPSEVSKRLNEVNLQDYKEQVSGFTVSWRDGQENQKGENNGVNKKIIYIPQSYLNRLVDKKEDKTSIDDIIENILKQGEDVKNAFLNLEESNRSVEKSLTQEIENLFYKETDIKELNKEFQPLSELARKSKALEEKIKKLEVEEGKLKEITTKEEKFGRLKFDYNKLIRFIAEKHSKFFNNYSDALAKISEQKSITKDRDLEFGINIIFENTAFQNNCINEICDQRKLSQFEEGFLQDYKRSDNANFKDDIEKIMRSIRNGKLTLVKAYSRKEALTKLLKNWFSFDYKIKYNDDEISDMSPGKKSFVLLKLLIELDNSKCPILLDQPEDDLDNRSIYNDLVKFIKTKKKERQIIIATHNPNLVVGADSECVIVANQAGDKARNKTYTFEYVQGALENTFIIEEEDKVLYRQGIQEHVCDILEGGKRAFQKREQKYNFRS